LEKDRARKRLSFWANHNRTSYRQALRLPGAKLICRAFFCYCGVEGDHGLWIASYLVLHRGCGCGPAARFASIFYLALRPAVL
jgi:fucose permease